MSLLNTKNPSAVHSLMTETIFDIDFQAPVGGKDSGDEPATLQDIGTNNAKEEVVSIPMLHLYGGNKKKILFIIDRAGVQFFSKEAELAFLKTLEAMKLALDDVVVINVASFDQPIGFELIQKELSPEYWIFLGANPTSIQFGEYPENIWSQLNGFQILRTHSFDEMLTDIEKKRIFWNTVKLINN